MSIVPLKLCTFLSPYIPFSVHSQSVLSQHLWMSVYHHEATFCSFTCPSLLPSSSLPSPLHIDHTAYHTSHTLYLALRSQAQGERNVWLNPEIRIFQRVFAKGSVKIEDCSPVNRLLYGHFKNFSVYSVIFVVYLHEVCSLVLIFSNCPYQGVYD